MLLNRKKPIATTTMSVARWSMGQVLMWSTPTLPWPPADTAPCDSEAEQSRDSSAARFHPERLARLFASTFRPWFPTSYERGAPLVSAILLPSSIFPLVSINSSTARAGPADGRSFAWLKRHHAWPLMVGSGGRFCACSADGGSARTSPVSLHRSLDGNACQPCLSIEPSAPPCRHVSTAGLYRPTVSVSLKRFPLLTSEERHHSCRQPHDRSTSNRRLPFRRVRKRLRQA